MQTKAPSSWPNSNPKTILSYTYQQKARQSSPGWNRPYSHIPKPWLYYFWWQTPRRMYSRGSYMRPHLLCLWQLKSAALAKSEGMFGWRLIRCGLVDLSEWGHRFQAEFAFHNFIILRGLASKLQEIVEAAIMNINTKASVFCLGRSRREGVGQNFEQNVADNYND